MRWTLQIVIAIYNSPQTKSREQEEEDSRTQTQARIHSSPASSPPSGSSPRPKIPGFQFSSGPSARWGGCTACERHQARSRSLAQCRSSPGSSPDQVRVLARCVCSPGSSPLKLEIKIPMQMVHPCTLSSSQDSSLGPMLTQYAHAS